MGPNFGLADAQKKKGWQKPWQECDRYQLGLDWPTPWESNCLGASLLGQLTATTCAVARYTMFNIAAPGLTNSQSAECHFHHPNDSIRSQGILVACCCTITGNIARQTTVTARLLIMGPHLRNQDRIQVRPQISMGHAPPIAWTRCILPTGTSDPRDAEGSWRPPGKSQVPGIGVWARHGQP